MFKLKLIKSGIQILTWFGVGYIADNAINIVKPKHFTGIRKGCVNVGAWVLSAMAVDKATDYVEKIWDETTEQIKEFVKPEPEEVITKEEEA